MPRRCFLKVATIAVLGPSGLLSTDASALGLRGFGRGVVLNRLLSWVAGITLVATVVIGMSADARAERRVALVVGNATYNAAYMSLPSPRNDAEDLGSNRTGPQRCGAQWLNTTAPCPLRPLGAGREAKEDRVAQGWRRV
jgi:hypothetical protein